ncbi:MAG TPA: hypothetical protein VNG04_02190 [Candidatus Acidoferrum sp.]|nr:hypothetical protein [Candidatus Acidoferrum sp.]
MSGAFREFAEEVRRLVREAIERHAPPIERYRVVGRKPLTLEAFGSDQRLVDGEDGFDLTRSIRAHAKVGHTVVVSIDREGDKIAHGLVVAADEDEVE